MARDFFEFETLGKMSVKGKEQPVEAYRLVRATQVATRIEAATAKGLTRFVGREREMAVLKEALEKAKSGSGQVVGVVGEAGVGKSRLVLELRRMLAQDECYCFEGRCLHYGSSMPYLPLLDILRAYFDITEGEREFLVRKMMAEKMSRLDEKLGNILPPLHDLFSMKVEDEGYLWLDPQKKRERIFEAIRDLLIRESQRRPLVLAIDDLQWIDHTSNEFLNYFVDWLASSHILLILLYRPEYVHQWGSKSYYGQMRVEQLPTSASSELIRAMLEEGEVAPELRQLILSRTAGNQDCEVGCDPSRVGVLRKQNFMRSAARVELTGHPNASPTSGAFRPDRSIRQGPLDSRFRIESQQVLARFLPDSGSGRGRRCRPAGREGRPLFRLGPHVP